VWTKAGLPGVQGAARAVAAATVLLTLGAIALMRPAPPEVVRAAGMCNGSAALCDRPLNQVTFAGAHNAMSAADVPGWMFPQHERGVAAQLTDGIRAFLIDVHYGRPAGTNVVTDLDAETASRAKIEEARAEASRPRCGFATALPAATSVREACISVTGSVSSEPSRSVPGSRRSRTSSSSTRTRSCSS
jgi:hypothetical protein